MSLTRARLELFAPVLTSLALVAGCDEGRQAGDPKALERQMSGRVAYSSGGDGFADVYTIRPDGTHRQRLTRRPGDEFDPSWSPDGSRVVYRDSRRGINENDDIYVMSGSGADSRNLSRRGANEWSPAWSADGRWIAFAAERGGLAIWVMRQNGTQQRRLTDGTGDEYPTWSPDSATIAFSRLGDIWLVDRDGTHVRPLGVTVQEESLPAWSPDGRRVAFSVGYEGSRTIAVVGRDARERKQLTEPGHDDTGAAWSPDGRRIVFSRDGVLTHMNADGSDVRSMGARGLLPDWGPRSKG